MIDITKMGTITSGFGNRKAPVKGATSFHDGIDIVLKDDNIPSVFNGFVMKKGYSKGNGNFISVKTLDGWTANYLHMSEPSKLEIGSQVEKGQTIGVQGSTGISTGKHLHFSITSPSGEKVNPSNFLKEDLLISPSNKNVSRETKHISGIFRWVFIILVITLGGFLFLKMLDIKNVKGMY